MGATSIFIGDKTTGSKCFSLVKNTDEKLGYRNTNLEYTWFNPFEPSNDELLFQTGWHQITVVCDGSGTMSVYLDGQFYQSITTDTEFDLNSFGMAYPTNQYSFNGFMDDIRLYNYALTTEEVGSLYVLVPANGELAYWPLNGNALEVVSNVEGNVGGALPAENKLFTENQAMHFDGNSYIEHPTNTLSGLNKFSVNIWHSVETGAQMGKLLSVYKDADNYMEIINLGGFRYYVNMAVEGNTFSTHANYTQSQNSWDMMTVVFDGTLADNERIKIYRNNQLITSSGTTTPQTLPSLINVPVVLGARRYSGSLHEPFTGKLDEVSVFNYDLSLSEIESLYTPPASMIGHWPLDGNGDELKYGNIGTVSGAIATTDRFGNPTGAMSFNGIDNFIDVGDTDLYDFGSNDFTLSCWFSLEELPGEWKSLINKGASVENGYGLEISNDNNPTASITATTHQSASAIVNPSLDEWYQMVAVYDRNEYISIYINGELINQFPFDAGNDVSISNGKHLYFGTLSSTQQFFKGKLDDIQIYNYALSASEIINLYLPTKELVAYWDLDNNTEEILSGLTGENVGAVHVENFNSVPAKAMYFDGSAYIESPVNPLSQQIKSTINLWHWVGIGVERCKLLSIYKNENNNIEILNYKGLRYYVNITIDGQEYSMVVNYPQSMEAWNMLTIVYDGTLEENRRVTIYHNKAKLTRGSAPSSLPILEDTPIIFGARNQGGALEEPFIGSLDNIGIFNYAMTAEEVTSLENLDLALVAHWPLDGNATDASGNGYDGVEHGVTPTSDRFGIENGAMSFNGIDNHIDLGEQEAWNFGDEDMSIAFWVKIEDDRTQSIISSKILGAEAKGFQFSYADTYKTLYGGLGTGTYVNQPSCNGSISNWHYVVYTRRNSTNTLYIDNIKCGEVDYLGDGDFNRALRFGFDEDASRYFKGKLDDIRIYNYALTERMINDLYWPAFSLIAHWPMDGNVNDVSTFENHGAYTEAVLTTDPYGNENNAYHFDGVDDEIVIGNQETFNKTFDNGITLTAWVKLDEVPSQVSKHFNVISKGGVFGYTPKSPFGLTFYADTDALYFDLFGDDQTRSALISSKTDWQADEWYHIVATWDGTTSANGQKLYINGVLNSQRAASVDQLLLNAAKLQIGASDASSSYWMDGTIDDMRIYNYGITIEEVTELYTPYTVKTLNINTLAFGSNISYTLNGAGLDETTVYTCGEINEVIPDEIIGTEMIYMNLSDASNSQQMKLGLEVDHQAHIKSVQTMFNNHYVPLSNNYYEVVNGNQFILRNGEIQTTSAVSSEGLNGVALEGETFTLSGFGDFAGAEMKVYELNPSKNLVRTVSGDPFVWDKKDDGGVLVPSGIYLVVIELNDGSGKSYQGQIIVN